MDPANLFRITWKNEPVEHGGLYNQGNWIEFPEALTGVKTRIIGLLGKWFPTGAHKVGAAFGCLVPRIVSGQFDPTTQKAVWPSTGNYCRGGAFDSALVGCDAVAILPEGMSRERFDWLRDIAAEVIATPGCESNVKEIYDKCWEIRRTRPECVIFNQFEEFGNPIWHYHVTGNAIQDIFESLGPSYELAGYVSATGSAGTIAAGDFLRTIHPHLRVVATEAQQCPRCSNSALANIASKALVTSTCRGSTTSAIRTWSRRSMTSAVWLVSTFQRARGTRAFGESLPDAFVETIAAAWAFRRSAIWSERSRRPSTMTWTSAM